MIIIIYYYAFEIGISREWLFFFHCMQRAFIYGTMIRGRGSIMPNENSFIHLCLYIFIQYCI